MKSKLEDWVVIREVYDKAVDNPEFETYRVLYRLMCQDYQIRYDEKFDPRGPDHRSNRKVYKDK